MIYFWSVVALYLMVAPPVFLAVFGFNNDVVNYPVAIFAGTLTLIGLAMAISSSRHFFLVRRMASMFEDSEPPKAIKVKAKKQRRCKNCGQYLTRYVPSTKDDSIYMCSNCKH